MDSCSYNDWMNIYNEDFAEVWQKEGKELRKAAMLLFALKTEFLQVQATLDVEMERIRFEVQKRNCLEKRKRKRLSSASPTNEQTKDKVKSKETASSAVPGSVPNGKSPKEGPVVTLKVSNNKPLKTPKLESLLKKKANNSDNTKESSSHTTTQYSLNPEPRSTTGVSNQAPVFRLEIAKNSESNTSVNGQPLVKHSSNILLTLLNKPDLKTSTVSKQLPISDFIDLDLLDDDDPTIATDNPTTDGGVPEIISYINKFGTKKVPFVARKSTGRCSKTSVGMKSKTTTGLRKFEREHSSSSSSSSSSSRTLRLSPGIPEFVRAKKEVNT